jgi:transposase-like protein
MVEKLIVCPYCGQDWVQHVRIVESGTQFWLCFECESIWLSEEWISAATAESLKDFLASEGHDPKVTEIERSPVQSDGTLS